MKRFSSGFDKSKTKVSWSSSAAEGVPQFHVCLVELGLAGARCKTQTPANFAVSEAIHIVQQNYVPSRFRETAQRSPEGDTFNQE